MKRRPTPKQIAAARANGAKSRGPVTDAGKQASSRNSLKAGIYSEVLVLDNEQQIAYEQLTAEYMDHYDPQTPVERDLVNDIVAARWRLTRAMGMQTASLNLEMDRQHKRIEAEFIKIQETARCAIAFNALANARGFATLDRHETHLRRTVEKSTTQLEKLQAARREAETQICENEPDDVQPAPPEQHPATETIVPSPAISELPVAPRPDNPARPDLATEPPVTPPLAA